MKKLISFFALFFALSFVLWGAAASTTATAVAAAPQNKNLVGRIETYINKIEHMQGRFSQQGPGNLTARGQFWLRRPWKMRFAYAAPNQSLIIADGQWLAIQNTPSTPAQRYPLGATPARFILAPNLRLKQEAKITGITQKRGKIHIWLASRDDNLPGRIQLRFRQNPIALEGWTIIDAQGMTTKISLTDVQRGIRASNRLFFVEDSQHFKRRR